VQVVCFGIGVATQMDCPTMANSWNLCHVIQYYALGGLCHQVVHFARTVSHPIIDVFNGKTGKHGALDS
jgi:hypothetical protein